MTTFKLPDLGEGLAEAEIVRWHVKVGDRVEVDQPIVAVETAKAVVEVPSPFAGVVKALHGNAGDAVATGAPLIEFEIEGDAAVSAPATHAKARAAPAVRALAKRLGVDLAQLQGSGRDGLVTADDVTNASGSTPLQQPAAARAAAAPARRSSGDASDGAEPLRGLRRSMAHSMSLARDSVMQCTLFDDADLHAWTPDNDYTTRLLRAIAAGCSAAPALNAWFDSEAQTRRLMPRIDVGMATDTADGLLVPVIRDVGGRSAEELRKDVDRLKRSARDRSVAPEELRDFTFMLSNFGMIAGRYGTPVVVPPAVAILGAGRLSHDVVAVMGGVEAHLRMPLSLTFDHRCITGGEAARFLAAVLADLQRSV